MSAEYFPLGIASDEAFCNRDSERKVLAQNITKTHHTLLLSPRRYGKTSLIFQVLHESGSKWTYGTTDLLIAVDEQSVQNMILKCVGKMIAKILPTHKKALDSLKNVISSMSPKIVISDTGPSIEFSPVTKPHETIVEALLGLDKIAGEYKRRAVFVMDEFQQINSIKQGKVLEASIRHVVERAKNTSYIFSGSDRQLLAAIFDDSNRPLYHLCDQMILERIAAKEYENFLQPLAQKKWRKLLDKEVINMILQLTQCHAYYLNVLCSRLWSNSHLPDAEMVIAAWRDYVISEQSRISYEIANLSANQRAVLNAIAQNPTDQVTSKSFLHQVRLPQASVNQAINVLLKNDLLLRDENGVYRLLDPAMNYFLYNILSSQ